MNWRRRRIRLAVTKRSQNLWTWKIAFPNDFSAASKVRGGGGDMGSGSGSASSIRLIWITVFYVSFIVFIYGFLEKAARFKRKNLLIHDVSGGRNESRTFEPTEECPQRLLIGILRST